MESLRQVMDFAVDAVWQAGKITLEYFQTPIETFRKADASPVTVADRRSEERLRELISARFPEDAILGEEFGESGPSDARRRWILDPIDGTISFVRGVPIFGVMAALEIDGEPAVGAVNFPALGEIVYAARGEGCYWNGRPARVSSVDRLEEAVVLATDVAAMAMYGREAAYSRLCAGSRLQRTWGDCYGHALVATGRAEAMLDPIMNIWDTAALMPIVVEAGGTFSDWSGNPTHRAPEALSTNGVLFEAIMDVLSAE